jgi:hypothetical protein
MPSNWEQFEEVQPQQDWSAFEESGLVNEPAPVEEPQVDRPETKAESTWSRMKNLSLNDVLLGGGEAILTGATNLYGMAEGGLRGIENEINRIPQKPEKWSDRQWQEYQQRQPDQSFADTVEQTVEKRTYQPKTIQGQALLGGIDDTARQVSRKVTDWLPGVKETEMPLYDLAFATGGEDDTVGAAAVYTGLSMATAVLGGRLFGSEGTLEKQLEKGAKGRKPKGGSEKVDAAYSKLEADVNNFYKQADAAGGGVQASYLDSVRNNVVQKMTDEGYAPGIHPGAAEALKVINEAAGKNHTLKGMEVIRKQLNGAMSLAVRNSKEDARMVGMIRDMYDEAYVSIPNQAFIGTATDAPALYAQGRKLASQKFKADEITWAIERARLRSGQFTGSGFDNALKTEFRQILMNKNRRRQFNDNEVKLLEAIVDGTAAQKAASFLGRFAVRGAVSGALVPGSAAAMFGPVGAIMSIAIGEGGRQLSTALRRGSANKAALDVIEGKTK